MSLVFQTIRSLVWRLPEEEETVVPEVRSLLSDLPKDADSQRVSNELPELLNQLSNDVRWIAMS